MAQLLVRRASFDSACATLYQLLVDTKTDITGADSDSVELRRLRDRIRHGLTAMGLPVKGSEL